MSIHALGRLFDRRRVRYPLDTGSLPIVYLSHPPVLSFSTGTGNGEPLKITVRAGDEVEPGHVLAEGDNGRVLPCPVKGTVTAIAGAPDIRGGRRAEAIVVEPAGGVEPTHLEGLDPENTGLEAVTARIRQAGLDKLLPTGEREAPETLVVLAADREPAVCSAVELFRERKGHVVSAARLAGRLHGAGRIVLAVPDPLAAEAEEICRSRQVEVMPLPPFYPDTLETVVATRIGGGPVIPLEDAIDALDAVRRGLIPRTKVLTVVGPEGVPVANYRVLLGTRFREILSHAGLEPGERDKVIAGGPMRGYAQYSLDGSVDSGVDAVTVVAADSMPEWTDEPCINCGGCIDACPMNLQVQLIGRYAEFELLDRTVELEIDRCVECGLCAAVCTARRPLLQWIRLARRELAAAKEGP